MYNQLKWTNYMNNRISVFFSCTYLSRKFEPVVRFILGTL
jgi:hypothetical protein